MKKWLLVLSMLFAGAAHAQNYQCLQFGAKNYFTNGNGYLRGIRIDSVNVVGSDTVYHAFHTPRARGYISGCNVPASADPDGGSWLGKDVIQRSDGTFLFDNIWHDTVIIKSQALLGDTWRFFDDTTNIHYTATVTSFDTMTVLGSLDSIKTITITADTAGIPRLSDPVNNFQIKLSKDHGFVQIFDLYTFPYHLPDSLSDIAFVEYYLDLIIGRNDGVSYDFLPGPWHYGGVYIPDTTNSVFRLVSLHNPTKMGIYSFVNGDVYKHYRSESHLLGGGGAWIYTDFDDTVINSFYTATTSSYYISKHYNEITYPAGSLVHHDIVQTEGGDTTQLIDPYLMPEEKGSQYFYHYLPNEGPDTSYCSIKGRYVVNKEHIATNATVVYGNNVDIGRALFLESSTYYEGYGLWGYKLRNVTMQIDIDDNTTYFYKNGVVCYGAYRWLTVINDVNAPITEVQLIPNPANELLTVKTNITGAYPITITNILGQLVSTSLATTENEVINISTLANGLYNTTVTDTHGNRVTQKLVISH